MSIVGGNAVWRRFIVNQMPEWLKWLKSVHLPSHLRLWTKYLDATPPKNAYSRMKRVGGDDEELLTLLFIPDESFWKQLEVEVGEEKSSKMYRVALSLTMDDFLHDLTLYAQQFPEIRSVIMDAFSRFSSGFNYLFGLG